MIAHKEFVEIKIDADCVDGLLEVPDSALGVAVFAYGGDNDRISSRGSFVAKQLQQARIGTVQLNLLTKRETQLRDDRLSISLLTQRLNAVCDWLAKNKVVSELPLGLMGTGNGAVPILNLVAAERNDFSAIVLRGAKLEMTNRRTIKNILTPTLFIIGGCDHNVLTMNRRIYFLMNCKKKLEIIPGATHLFEERGALEKVSELATSWFLRHMEKPVLEHHLKKL